MGMGTLLGLPNIQGIQSKANRKKVKLFVRFSSALAAWSKCGWLSSKVTVSDVLYLQKKHISHSGTVPISVPCLFLCDGQNCKLYMFLAIVLVFVQLTSM